MTDEWLKEFLEEKYLQYNNVKFIESDPVAIPRSFTDSGDIEIAGFLTAIISWGIRKTILKNGFLLMKMMDNHPYDFVMNAGEEDLKTFETFKHRTFNGTDAVGFIRSLQNIYKNHGGLKAVFVNSYTDKGDMRMVLSHFRKIFFEKEILQRSKKHIADVDKNASAKRLNMFLRWMVRKDSYGVDFGIWNEIPPSALYLPLDVHTGNIARKLGLLQRRQNDWPSVVQLTTRLREFDPVDPVKYDYALFGLGIFENF